LKSPQQAPRETHLGNSGSLTSANPLPDSLRYNFSEDHEKRSMKPSLSKSAPTAPPTSAIFVKPLPASFRQTAPDVHKSTQPSLSKSAQQAASVDSIRPKSAVRSLNPPPGGAATAAGPRHSSSAKTRNRGVQPARRWKGELILCMVGSHCGAPAQGGL